jgi:hypothetical protein
MAGERARMVVMGLFYPDQQYRPSLFDVCFDRVFKTVFGLVFMGMSIKDHHISTVETPGRAGRRQACPSKARHTR